MPAFVTTKVARALNEDRKAVNGSRALVIGVAYKKDIDDVRESPALDVMRLLDAMGADVAFHDPYIAMIREDGHEKFGVPLTDEELSAADAVVIVTDHSSIDYQRLVDLSDLVIDSRNATARTRPSRARVMSLSMARESDEPAGAGA
jgi:UDP-N-acetyl-D-glucosamine dehydrogenase